MTVNDDFINLLVGDPVDGDVDRNLLVNFSFVALLIVSVGRQITGETAFRVGSNVVVRPIYQFSIIFNEIQGWTLPASTRYQR